MWKGSLELLVPDNTLKRLLKNWGKNMVMSSRRLITQKTILMIKPGRLCSKRHWSILKMLKNGYQKLVTSWPWSVNNTLKRQRLLGMTLRSARKSASTQTGHGVDMKNSPILEHWWMSLSIKLKDMQSTTLYNFGALMNEFVYEIEGHANHPLE